MLHTNTIPKQSSYFIIILLVSFMIFLLVLFIYLQNIDKKMQEYYSYKKTLINLEGYNHELDNVLIHSYRYIDVIAIFQFTSQFENELVYLRDNDFMQKWVSLSSIS
ncbi:MAG: hypothetical protein Q9M36_07055 [Sulfurovum sp.]|nr:hypothetical protein [Sulfurovum sp.]